MSLENLYVIVCVSSQAGEPLKIPPLDTVKVLGIGGSPTKAYYNGEAIEGFTFNTTNQVLLTSMMILPTTSSLRGSDCHLLHCLAVASMEHSCFVNCYN